MAPTTPCRALCGIDARLPRRTRYCCSPRDPWLGKGHAPRDLTGRGQRAGPPDFWGMPHAGTGWIGSRRQQSSPERGSDPAAPRRLRAPGVFASSKRRRSAVHSDGGSPRSFPSWMRVRHRSVRRLGGCLCNAPEWNHELKLEVVSTVSDFDRPIGA